MNHNLGCCKCEAVLFSVTFHNDIYSVTALDMLEFVDLMKLNHS